MLNDVVVPKQNTIGNFNLKAENTLILCCEGNFAPPEKYDQQNNLKEIIAEIFSS